MRWAIFVTVLHLLSGQFTTSEALAQASSVESDSRKDEGFKALTDLLKRNLADNSARWICIPSSKFFCSRVSCEMNRNYVTVLLDFTKQTYTRCDDTGCQSHPISHSYSGIYTYAYPASGAFFKAVNDGSSFVEAVSMGEGVFISYGRCNPNQ